MTKKENQHPPTPRIGSDLKSRRPVPPAVSRRGPLHLLGHWPDVARRFRRARHIALLLDFDGTIVPIQPSPEMVWLDSPTRRLIGRLAGISKVTVSIVSGRRLADLRRRARVPGVFYVGVHGCEWDGKSSAAIRHAIPGKTKRILKESLGSVPGIHLEDKKVSLAVHYRGADASSVRRARKILHGTLQHLDSHLNVLMAKMAWEVLPPEVQGKGSAVRRLLMKLSRRALPIYLGDDTTDESAFEVLKHGVTVHVGRRSRTKARYYLRNPDEAVAFLQRLEAEIR